MLALTKKQTEQIEINTRVIDVFADALNELYAENNAYVGWQTPTRLRTCNARVYETDNYYILESYTTFIACINKSTHECFDALRHVYGYTSTSAQHIAKFWHDYTPYHWNNSIYTFREI